MAQQARGGEGAGRGSHQEGRDREERVEAQTPRAAAQTCAALVRAAGRDGPASGQIPEALQGGLPAARENAEQLSVLHASVPAADGASAAKDEGPQVSHAVAHPGAAATADENEKDVAQAARHLFPTAQATLQQDRGQK